MAKKCAIQRIAKAMTHKPEGFDTYIALAIRSNSTTPRHFLAFAPSCQSLMPQGFGEEKGRMAVKPNASLEPTPRAMRAASPHLSVRMNCAATAQSRAHLARAQFINAHILRG